MFYRPMIVREMAVVFDFDGSFVVIESVRIVWVPWFL